MKFHSTLLLGAALLLALACKNGDGDAQATKVSVPSITLKDTTCVVEFTYPATLKGVQDVAIYPQVNGRIVETKVKEGQYVTNNQVLFVIDDIPFKAAYDAAVAAREVAKSQVESAKLTLESKQRLFDDDIISEYQLKLAKISLLTAEAQLGEAEAQVTKTANELSFTRVKSSGVGYVGSLPFVIGSLVGTSMTTPLTTVSDNSSMYADFSVPENAYLELAAAGLTNGGSEKLRDNFPPLSLIMNNGVRYGCTGTIHSVSGLFSPETGALPIRAIFPNENKQLLSGGAAQVVFSFEQKNVILIPRSAMKEIQDKLFVFKIVNGTLEQTAVSADRYNNEMWILHPNADGTYPLKSGDVITGTTNRLNDGMAVEIKN